MTQPLNEEFNLLIAEYDTHQKEILQLQEGIGKAIMAAFGGAWKGAQGAFKDSRRKAQFEKIVKEIDGAMKADDEKVLKAMKVLKNSLEQKTKKLDDIEKKIAKKADPELSKMLSGVMDQNKNKNAEFLKALETFAKISDGKVATSPTAPAPTAPSTPAAPASAPAAPAAAPVPAATTAAPAPAASKPRATRKKASKPAPSAAPAPAATPAAAPAATPAAAPAATPTTPADEIEADRERMASGVNESK